jgi:putative peptidoglycan lipid II flippase
MGETSTVTERKPSAPSTLNSSVKFGMVSLLAYGFSFGKSLVVANYFGTSAEMDAFTLAALLPNLLATLLTGGFAISLVPALAAADLKGRDERANTFRAGLLLFTSTATLAAVLLAALARPAMKLIAPGFDAGKQMLAAGLLRWCAALLPLNAVYAYCSAELLSRRKYVAVAAAPIISTVISVAALLAFARSGVKVLAMGLVAGTLFQAAAVAMPAWITTRLHSGLHWWTLEVKSLMREQAPLLLISSFGVVNVSVDQFMAGLLPSGSAAALSFATNLNLVVTQVVVMAASWVLLPELSKLAAEGKHEALKLKVRESISGISLVAIPAAIAIFVLGGTAVQVLFQHGRFDGNSTQQVSRIWMGYTCGLLPFAVAMVPVRLLNATRQNRFLVRVGIAALAVNSGLDYLLMRWLGPVGISLSTSLVYLCSSILIFRFVRSLVPGIVDSKFWSGILRALLVCAPVGAALWMFRQAFSGVMALVVGGLLFVAMIYAIYLRLGLVHVPLKKLRAVAAQ